MSIIYFALLLGPLIFFHEFGHFIVARMCGVRVLEFSIGFGPQLGSFKRGDTVYRIGALPLGGYVKMLGADPLEEIPPEQEADSFGAKELWKRTLIVLAGPAFNLILPFFVFFFLFLGQAEVNPAVLGTLQPDGVAAQAGLQPGDIIVEIDGNDVEGWWELQDLVGGNGGKAISVVVERNGVKQPEIELTPKLINEMVAPELGLTRDIGRIQIELAFRKPVIMVAPGSAAAASGLQSWDRIIALDGEPVSRWAHVQHVLKTARSSVQVTVLRETALGTQLKGMDRWQVSTIGPAQTVTFDPASGDATAGLKSAEFFVYDITPESNEAKAGLQRGDEILTLNGRRLSSWGLLQNEVRSHPDQVHTLTYQRDGQEHTVKLTFEQRDHKSEFNTDITSTIFGMVNRSMHGYPDTVSNEKRVAYAIYRTWTETKHVFVLTAASLAGLFTGQVGIKQMGGPIFIYEVASKTGEAGWSYFFKIMVWLSISLGLINLVPIPLLDGGHLMFFLIEAIKRRPVSLRTRQIAAYIGFSMIILLMLLVFKNDLGRSQVWDGFINLFQ